MARGAATVQKNAKKQAGKNSGKPVRLPPPTQAQKDAIIGYMERHVDFARGRLNGPGASKMFARLQNRLGHVVNEVGHGDRDGKKWWKCWLDLRGYAKSFAASNHSPKSTQTGGGGPEITISSNASIADVTGSEELTSGNNFIDRIMNILGWHTALGIDVPDDLDEELKENPTISPEMHKLSGKSSRSCDIGLLEDTSNRRNMPGPSNGLVTPTAMKRREVGSSQGPYNDKRSVPGPSHSDMTSTLPGKRREVTLSKSDGTDMNMAGPSAVMKTSTPVKGGARYRSVSESTISLQDVSHISKAANTWRGRSGPMFHHGSDASQFLRGNSNAKRPIDNCDLPSPQNVSKALKSDVPSTLPPMRRRGSRFRAFSETANSAIDSCFHDSVNDLDQSFLSRSYGTGELDTSSVLDVNLTIAAAKSPVSNNRSDSEDSDLLCLGSERDSEDLPQGEESMRTTSKPSSGVFSTSPPVPRSLFQDVIDTNVRLAKGLEENNILLKELLQFFKSTVGTATAKSPLASEQTVYVVPASVPLEASPVEISKLAENASAALEPTPQAPPAPVLGEDRDTALVDCGVSPQENPIVGNYHLHIPDAAPASATSMPDLFHFPQLEQTLPTHSDALKVLIDELNITISEVQQ